MRALSGLAGSAAQMASAGAKDEWTKIQPTLRAQIQNLAPSIKPQLQAAFGALPAEARQLMMGPAKDAIKARPDEANLVLQMLAQIGVPGAGVLTKLVAVFGIAMMIEPIAELLAFTAEVLDPTKPNGHGPAAP